jgi:hypothetical protein
LFTMVIVVAGACAFESSGTHARMPKGITRIARGFELASNLLMLVTFL